jgi:hypothetical protein
LHANNKLTSITTNTANIGMNKKHVGNISKRKCSNTDCSFLQRLAYRLQAVKIALKDREQLLITLLEQETKHSSVKLIRDIEAHIEISSTREKWLGIITSLSLWKHFDIVLP